MFEKLKLFFLWLHYKSAELRNIYTHKAVGQSEENGKTMIFYTIMGKRDLYRIDIEDIMGNKELLERFHPTQAAKFGAIALGEVLFSLPLEEREKRYNDPCNLDHRIWET